MCRQEQPDSQAQNGEQERAKFYRLSPQGRLQVLVQEGVITAEDMQGITGFTGQYQHPAL